jgi:REP element-mobilizing transposase RayT
MIRKSHAHNRGRGIRCDMTRVALASWRCDSREKETPVELRRGLPGDDTDQAMPLSRSGVRGLSSHRSARQLRIEFLGAVYDITAPGNARQDIFIEDDDRELFLRVLGKIASRFKLVVYAYCLMGNHYHLLLETPEANLSKALRQLNGVIHQALNRCHGRVGHVLQGRWKAILVDKDSYLPELCRYVVLTRYGPRWSRSPKRIAGPATEQR